MIALARRLHTVTYSRYLAVSVVALATDLGLFALLCASGRAPSVASALGYSIGIAVHWLLSSRMVFATTLGAPGMDRARQQMLFVLSALVGLSLTVAIVGIGSLLIDPGLAKLIAVAVSFQATYLLRTRIVFT